MALHLGTDTKKTYSPGHSVVAEGAKTKVHLVELCRASLPILVPSPLHDFPVFFPRFCLPRQTRHLLDSFDIRLEGHLFPRISILQIRQSLTYPVFLVFSFRLDRFAVFRMCASRGEEKHPRLMYAGQRRRVVSPMSNPPDCVLCREHSSI
jgi:hypothetical protein